MKCFEHARNNVTKFTRYISDNYFLISYKALFYIVVKSVGLTKLWKWMNSRLDRASLWTLSKSKKRQVTNRENNKHTDHDDESEEEVTIADFVEEMNLVNE